MAQLAAFVVSTAPAGESAEGTTVTTVGPTIIDAAGNVYSISSAGYVVTNGQPETMISANVIELVYHAPVAGGARQLYQRNAAGDWFTRTSVTSTYVDAADPTVTPVTPPTNYPAAAGPGPAASSNFITADFTNMTSGAGVSGVVVRPQLFGVSSGGFDNGNWQWVNNSTFRSRMRALNLPLFRVHSQWQQKGNNIATLASNIGSMVPSTCTMVIGLYNPSSGQSVSNQWRTGSPVGCTLWEGGNEDTKFSQANINTMIASLQADNPANKVAGDVNAGFVPGNLSSLVNSMNASTLGLLDQHQYFWSYYSGDARPSDAAVCLADGKYRGWMQSLDATINSGYGATLPYMMGEYNIEAGAYSGDLRAGTSIGACFLISSLFGMQDGTKRPIWSGIWDLMDDGGAAYQLIDSSFNVYPQYYTLQRLIATMPGNLVNTASGSNAGGVKAWATSNGGNYGVAIVNSNSGNASGTVALSHWPVNTTGSGTATLWTYPSTNLSSPAANTPGIVSTITVTNGVTQSITVPANSCVIIST